MKQILKKTELKNGITILTDYMPHAYSVAVGAWIPRGSRHEDPDECGLSHFYEHLVFKGTQKRTALEIARAISARPGLLLLDEIAAGLSSEEVTEILEIVAALKAEGVTIIWIEHMMDTMLRAADTLVCMAEGRVALTGEPEEVLRSRAVEELYLGRLGEEAEHADGGTPAGEV